MRNLILVTVLVVAAAAWAVWQRDAGHTADAASGPFVPALSAAVNDVTALQVTSGGESFRVARADDGWVLADWGDYPAAFETVKATVTGLADMEIRTRMTGLPERHANLGLEDPSGAEAASVGLRVEGAGGAVLADLVVGNAREGRPAGVYVRHAGDDQTWLVTGSVAPPKDAAGWADKELLRLPAERVASVEIVQADGEVVRVQRPAPPADVDVDVDVDEATGASEDGESDAAAGDTAAADDATADAATAADAADPLAALDLTPPAEQPEWELADLPAGWTVQSPYVLGNIAGGLARLDLERVAGDDDALPADDAWTSATVATSDGLTVAMQLGADADETTWYGRFAVSAAGDAGQDVRDEAARLGARLGGRTFVLPSWRVTTFDKRLADLADPPPPEPELEEGQGPLAPGSLPVPGGSEEGEGYIVPTPAAVESVLPPPVPEGLGEQGGSGVNAEDGEHGPGGINQEAGEHGGHGIDHEAGEHGGGGVTHEAGDHGGGGIDEAGDHGGGIDDTDDTDDTDGAR